MDYLHILSKEYKQTISPNFTRNRFDLTFDKNVYLLEYSINESSFFLYSHLKGKTLFLGLYLMELSKDEFESLIDLTFKTFKKIDRIKIFSSCNTYKNVVMENNIDYVTYLPNGEEQYMKSLSSEWRYNLKRKRKKLNSEFNDIKINKYSTNDLPDKIFKKYFEYKKITHHKNYFLSAQSYIKKFYVTDIYVLLLNNNIEAIVLNSDVDNNIYLENVTYNTKLSKYSLGIILLHEMIKDCIKNHKKCIFWGTNNDYKKHFSNYSKVTYSGYIYKDKITEKRYNFLKNILRFKFLTKNS